MMLDERQGDIRLPLPGGKVQGCVTHGVRLVNFRE